MRSDGNKAEQSADDLRCALSKTSHRTDTRYLMERPNKVICFGVNFFFIAFIYRCNPFILQPNLFVHFFPVLGGHL